VATVSIDISSDCVILSIDVVGSSIKTNLDPSKKAIANVITEIDVLRKRIVSCACLNNIPRILVISCDGLGIGVVWVDFLNSGAKGCIPEELTDMSDIVRGGDGIVGKDSNIHVG
jgi:hypothetical protein